MPDRKVFHDSVVSLPVDTGLTPNGLVVQPAAAEHRDESMTLHFSLALPEQAEADLRTWRAAVVVLAPDAPHHDGLRAAAEQLLGPAQEAGGLLLWKIS